jgi:23S rRNA pseudouridine1911/1915/1917 synthase
MKIKVLYEDKDILVIDKPSGISVHSDGRTKEKTITDWVLKNYPKMKNVGEPMGEIVRPGIVHRLDRGTSGVLVLAKNQKTHQFLKNQFQNRVVKKTYIAIVSGFVKNEHGFVDKPIGRSPIDFRRRLAGRGAKGEMREAKTEYKVLKRFTAPACKNFSSCAYLRVPGGTLGDKNFHKLTQEKFTYIKLKPKTGRTHQIRVHMKFLNHPVVCDSLYNREGVYPKGLSRLALHAQSIEFKDMKGKNIKVESPLPKEFKKMMK